MNSLNLNKYALIIVFVVVVVLSYFFSDRFMDIDASQRTDVSQQDSIDTSKQTAKKTGPHGAYDPHAALTPEKHIQVALQHKQEGRLTEAMRSLDTAIRQNSSSKDLYAVRGSLYLELQQPARAIADFDLALIISPDDSALLTNRAQAYRQFGQIEQALNDLNNAITINPDLVAARFNRGAIYYSSGDLDRALQDFNHCIAIDPHLAGPYFNRAATRHALNDLHGARTDIDRFLQISKSEAWKTTARDLLERWNAEGKTQGDKAAKL